MTNDLSSIDISTVVNAEASRFLRKFFQDRQINREFYENVPDGAFDFRMVDTPTRKSDSPRESLVHQIDVERDYCQGIETGSLSFRHLYEDLQQITTYTKVELLEMLLGEDKRLVRLLSLPSIENTLISVPWTPDPQRALVAIWGLDSHEILHTGWNLAIMDHLEMNRFGSLKRMWG